MGNLKTETTKRVFHIDQECFIIFAEDLSSKKERFLRIGNSPFLKEFGHGLTFITLISPLYPGDPFKELEIFRPVVDRKVIGLRSVINNFTDFLKSGGVDTANIIKVIAEDPENEGRIKAKKSEKEFLDELQHDRRKVKHSFAAFYNDGNIRVFNKSENIFDLKEYLAGIIDEKSEISTKSDFFKRFYESSYKKDGFIISGKTMFVFSDGRFACITDTADWVRDALRVGIKPETIKFLYVANGVYPDSLWLKTFMKKDKTGEKIRLVLREKDPLWLKLISEDIFEPLFPEKDTIDIELNNVRLMFQNRRIFIVHNNIKYSLDGDAGFMDENSVIRCDYIVEGVKERFEIRADYNGSDAVTVMKYNPVIFESPIDGNRLIMDFIKTMPKNDNYKVETPDSDDDTLFNNYNPDKIKNYGTKLVYKNLLNYALLKKSAQKTNPAVSLSGSDLNITGVIIEQYLGYDGSMKGVGFKERVSCNDFIAIPDELNPFLIFQKDLDHESLKAKISELEGFIKTNKIDETNKDIKAVKEKYRQISEELTRYSEAREDLKSFFDVVMTIEKQKEEHQKTIELSKGQKSERKNDNESAAKKIVEDKTTDVKSAGERTESNSKTTSGGVALKTEPVTYSGKMQRDAGGRRSGGAILDLTGIKRFIIPVIAAIIIVLLIVCGVLLLRNIRIKIPVLNITIGRTGSADNQTDEQLEQINSQEQFEEFVENRYNDELNKPALRSYHYRFYMTDLDKLNITNMIAEINGFHKIVYQHQKRYYSDKDPDKIFPGDTIRFSDGTVYEVVSGDTLWDICEKFLIKTVEKNEEDIRLVIEKTKTSEYNMETARARLTEISTMTYSEMVRDFLFVLLRQSNFEQWEPYINAVQVEDGSVDLVE